MEHLETAVYGQQHATNLRSYVAGLAAGLSQTLIGQPLDLIKTYVQASGRQMSMKELGHRVWHQHGLNLPSYYRGSSTMFLGSGILLAGELGLNKTFQSMVKRYKAYDTKKPMPLSLVALCGSLTGIFSFLICTPMEFCKIQMQMKTAAYSHYRGASNILLHKVLTGDLRTLFTGGISCAGREIFGAMIYFTLYEKTLRLLSKDKKASKLTPHIMLAGALAGTYHFFVYPFDVMKTQIQCGQARTYGESIEKIWRNNMMFRGVTITLIRSLPMNAVSFLVFERTQHALKKSGF